MTVSRLDQLYRRLLLTKFFTRGWGKPDNLKRLFAFRKILSNRDTCQHLVPADYPINIDKEYRDGDCVILEGHFTSPFIHHLPGIMPKEVETASFQVILPCRWRHSNLKPVCIHLAGTGDHYFWRRRILTARPLLKEAGIASILLENPYYGTRKPKQQLRSSLHNVSDLFVMGGALVLESLALLHWCEREGWGPLGLSGVSMGGHMASLAATNWSKPISLVPCLSWSTASCVFTQGVMSGAIPWKTLQEQFFENTVYQDEIRKLIISPEDNRRAYDMGQQFVKDYSHNIIQVESLHQQHREKPALERTPHGTPKVAGAESVIADVDSLRTAGLTDQSPHTLKTLNICNRDVASSDQGLVSALGSGGKEVVAVDSLSREEYVARVRSPQSLSAEQDISVLLPGRDKGQNVLSSANSSQGMNSLASLLTPASSWQQQQQQQQQLTTPVTLSSSSNLQQHAFSSSSSVTSNNLSVSPADTCTNQAGSPLKDVSSYTSHHVKSRQPYQSGQLHQSNVHSLSEDSSLALKDAMSKSRLMLSHPPTSAPANEQHMKDLQQEALDFMRGVMDECTHLGNFSVPFDPELIIIVSAKQDAYVPKDGVIGLDQLWPGCEVRYIDQGHVGAVLFNQSVFRKAIVDAFERQIKKYYQCPGSEPNLEHSIESVS